MASVVPATVIEIIGHAWVRHQDGSLTVLHPGSRISQGEIVTDSGSSVSLVIDGGAPLTLGASRSVAFTHELTTPADPREAMIRVDLIGSFTNKNQFISELMGAASSRAR